jgi:predicted nucleotidyltransferase
MIDKKYDFQNDEHPIDPDVRAEIEATLTCLENEHSIKVLFACESGSRGWGFASPDSDYDVRFIYVHKVDWYLTVFPGRDVIELPISDVYDVSGWDLRKALGLLRNGNATLVEWLSSPVIYMADQTFLNAVRDAAQQVDRPERAFHHYLHMAKKNYREHLRGETVRLKKYLYVLRPLLACLWIEQKHGPVPMRFQDLVDALVTEDRLKNAIADLLVIKRRAMESEHGLAMPAINQFLELHLNRLSHESPPLNEEVRDFTVLDRLLHDTVLG